MTRRRIPGIISIVAALSALAPALADACGNAVLATDKSIATVKEAEKILNEGDPAEARRRIEALMDGADEFDERTPSAKGPHQPRQTDHLPGQRPDRRSPGRAPQD